MQLSVLRDHPSARDKDTPLIVRRVRVISAGVVHQQTNIHKPLTYGVLRLYGEQEARREPVDVEDARRPVGVSLVGRQVLLAEVVVGEGYEPPDQGEYEP